MKPSTFILDGEIVIPVGKELSFDDLLQRIHPAESRVRKLAKELPATLGYDHFSQGRFRHGTKFLRWRPDKLPRQCTMDQVERKGKPSLTGLL